ncbi:MAG TPA: phospho-sugar mutase [Nocardioidaceae bacterium]|nr:phospho-sugar mutase [Nocardioidaceae bacterium]
MTTDELTARVRAWIDQDPDPHTRAELEQLLAEDSPQAADELADRFAGRLEFGTAGLRGALGAGPNRMNRVVVGQAAAGLGAYLLSVRLPGPPADQSRPRVVVGYDARHNSEVFAQDTAAILQGAGCEALLLPEALPTPVLAYAIRRLHCAAGVMVTASHNPPQDNGYKVYLGDGRQIAPPADTAIATAISAVGRADSLPRAEYRRLGGDLRAAYLREVLALVPAGTRTLRLVHTSLHGVGGALVDDVLGGAGFVDRHLVAEQQRPDPDFPTVAFPNPEEPGAMDLALELALRVDADLVLANDPDADRCAVAVPLGEGGTGRSGQHWRMLTGDEVGVLLADALLSAGVGGTYATTIVSASLLARMAPDRGATYAETLTGFKWLTRVDGLAYAYEEAQGYCVAPDLVRDKDGISALLLVCDLAERLHAESRSLLDRLDELADEYGVHATDQLSVRVDDLSLIADAMRRLRKAPPDTLGGLPVERVDDLSEGIRDLPPTDGLRLHLSSGGRVVVRPSGTEPKLKCYLEVVVEVGSSRDADRTAAVEAARIAAAGRLDAIKADLSVALGIGSA